MKENKEPSFKPLFSQLKRREKKEILRRGKELGLTKDGIRRRVARVALVTDIAFTMTNRLLNIDPEDESRLKPEPASHPTNIKIESLLVANTSEKEKNERKFLRKIRKALKKLASR